MRKLVTLCLMLISIFLFSQSDHPEKFNYTISETNKTISTINNYVVLQTGLSAEDAYKRVLLNIKGLYNNPKEVITATEEGEFIKISAIASDLYRSKVLGSIFSDDIHYNLEIYFKNERIKLEISRIEGWTNGSEYAPAGFYDASIILTHKKMVSQDLCIMELVSGYLTTLII